MLLIELVCLLKSNLPTAMFLSCNLWHYFFTYSSTFLFLSLHLTTFSEDSIDSSHVHLGWECLLSGICLVLLLLHWYTWRDDDIHHHPPLLLLDWHATSKREGTPHCTTEWINSSSKNKFSLCILFEKPETWFSMKSKSIKY